MKKSKYLLDTIDYYIKHGKEWYAKEVLMDEYLILQRVFDSNDEYVSNLECKLKNETIPNVREMYRIKIREYEELCHHVRERIYKEMVLYQKTGNFLVSGLNKPDYKMYRSNYESLVQTIQDVCLEDRILEQQLNEEKQENDVLRETIKSLTCPTKKNKKWYHKLYHKLRR